MTFPVAPGPREERPPGYSYAAVLVATDRRDEVLAVLRELRFTGWLARPDGGWLVAATGGRAAATAAGRRGVIDVAQVLAGRFPAAVLAVRVVEDRQLLLAAWLDGQELGRYLSDPSYGLPDDDDTLPDPLGADHAAAFAAACGRPGSGDELAGLLAAELAEDSEIESERLAGVLRLLGLPRWLVAVASLPRDVPTGPAARDLTRLGAGRSGLAGRLAGRAVDVVRRRRPPPPAVPDPPRGGADLDPWLM